MTLSKICKKCNQTRDVMKDYAYIRDTICLPCHRKEAEDWEALVFPQKRKRRKKLLPSLLVGVG